MPFDGLGIVRPQPPQLLPAGEFELDRDHALAAGLIGLWPLNGDARDYSLNAAHGAITGSPTPTIGPFGPCLAFSGSGQYITTPPVALDTSNFTMAAWVRPSSLSSRFTVFDLGVGAASSLEVGSTNGTVAAACIDTANYWVVSGANSIALNAWQLLAFTNFGSGITNNWLIYVNGRVAAVTYPTNGTSGTSSKVARTIGRRNGSTQYFNGQMAGVSLYNRALSAAEIACLYAEPFAMLAPRVRRTWVAVAGGATTITIAQASYLWSPAALGVNAKTQTTITQTPLRWAPGTLTANAKTQITAARQPWAWTPTPLATNQKTQAAIAQQPWVWSASPLPANQKTQTTLAQAVWRWTSQALVVGQPMLFTLARVAWFWRGRKLPGYGASALSQVQGLVSGFIRKFVSGLDETPPE